MSNRKPGVFRQPRKEYVTDISVSQIRLDKESLCKVSGYEISWHSTYTLPKISSIDKFNSTLNWLNKNELEEPEEVRKKTVILKQIISRGNSLKTKSTECFETVNDDKKVMRKSLNRNSSFITKLKDVIAREIGDSSNENLKESSNGGRNIEQEVWRTQSENDVIVKTIDVGTEPPSFCKIPTMMDTSVGTDSSEVQVNDKKVLQWKYYNKNIKDSSSSITVMDLSEGSTLTEGTHAEYASVSHKTTIEPANTFDSTKIPTNPTRSKNFTGTFKTKTKVSCLCRKKPKKPLKNFNPEEDLNKTPDITITIYDSPKPCRKSRNKSDSQVCSTICNTKRRPTQQTKSSVNLSSNESKNCKIPVLAKHRFQGPRNNENITRPPQDGNNYKTDSSKKPISEPTPISKNDESGNPILNLNPDETTTNIIYSNKNKTGDAPALSPLAKLEEQRCENHSLYLKNVKNYLYGTKSVTDIEKNEEKVCNVEVQTIKTEESFETKENLNYNDFFYVTDQTTQTPCNDEATQQPSYTIKCVEPKCLRKSNRIIKSNNIGTQMYEYLTASELYCREWIKEYLFHMEDLNPYTIKIDCRINNDSTKSSMTSSGSLET